MNTRSPAATARNSANNHIEWLIRAADKKDRKTPDTPITEYSSQARCVTLDKKPNSVGTLG